MRYLSFLKDGAAALGARVGDEVVDISAVLPNGPITLLALVQASDDVAAHVATAVASAPSSARFPLKDVTLLQPIGTPSKIICVGLNYADHRAEAGEEPKEKPAFPGMFHKYPSSLAAPHAPILRPAVSEALDFEGELAVVIGRRAYRVSEADALDHVFGYTILDDGSIRDYQVQKALAAGKNFDLSGSIGPEVVTKDELPEGGSGLKLETRINGTVMQSSNTELLIFNVAQIIALLSDIHALEPGDIIATGTCGGVGGARTPPVWLKAGDILEIEIEGIGILRNPVENEA